MGHKTNPRAFRIGTTTTWNAAWFARGKQYAKQLHEDLLIRQLIRKRLKDSGVASVKIERSPKALTVVLMTAKPGVVIGRGGAGAEDLKRAIQKEVLKDKKKIQLQLTIQEVMKPMLSAAIVSQQVAEDLQRRFPFRRSMRRAVDQVMKNGALGVKVIVSGRLDGAEIARTEKQTQGKVPLHSLRANIDYSRMAAFTMYGTVGVKVWIYLGDVFKE